jgi:type IV secretory pathway VirB4 component
MALDTSGSGITSETRYHLTEELGKYFISKNNNEKNDCNLTEFAEKHLKGNPQFQGDQDLYKRIYLYIGDGANEGPYARFFKKTNEIKSKDFICFDLAGLKGHASLKAVLIPALLEMICSNILGSTERERKKLLVMDEAWADLKGGAMADFMEEMFRTIRKLNGNISVITQRFLDVLDSDIGGALLTNTSYFWFVGNKHDPAPLEKAVASSSNGTISLTPYDIKTIIESQSKRDFYLLTPFFSGLLKLYPSKEFAMVATTDPDEKNILRKHMKKLGVSYVTPEVIESAKNEF